MLFGEDDRVVADILLHLDIHYHTTSVLLCIYEHRINLS
jgi:hypothetical protein